MPKLSIIIPCYNSSETVEETLHSVLSQDFQDWEAIIVNDGSKDQLEEVVLPWTTKDSRFKYYKKENGGLGTARNYGIKQALGVYILPLDSDNRVAPTFARKAVAVLEADSSTGVVHGDAVYFGEKEGKWTIPPFSKDEILLHNYIDACAIYRKSLWEEVGGYDTKMPHQGNEDWELWIAFAQRNVKFHHLKEITFQYRVTGSSMIRSFSREMWLENQNYVYRKYATLYAEAFERHYKTVKRLRQNYWKTTLFFFKKALLAVFRS